MRSHNTQLDFFFFFFYVSFTLTATNKFLTKLCFFGRNSKQIKDEEILQEYTVSLSNSVKTQMHSSLFKLLNKNHNFSIILRTYNDRDLMRAILLTLTIRQQPLAWTARKIKQEGKTLFDKLILFFFLQYYPN